MRYKSDLMEQILKSPEAQKIIDYVSPIYADSYIGLWIFEVIGLQLDNMATWSEEIGGQVVPQTATWALDLFEKEYGLLTNKAIPIDQRRRTLISKMQQKVAMNPAKLASIVGNEIGFPVKIMEFTGENEFKVLISALPGLVDENIIKSIVDPRKPAHLIYAIMYEQGSTGSVYWGCKACKGGILTARQVN